MAIIIKTDERKQETARTLAEYGIDYRKATSEQKEMAEEYNARIKQMQVHHGYLSSGWGSAKTVISLLPNNGSD